MLAFRIESLFSFLYGVSRTARWSEAELSWYGFGLATIKQAATKLGGEMFCYTDDGTFILDIMVQVKEQ